MILTFTIVFATLMLVVAAIFGLRCRHLLCELDDLKAKMHISEREKRLLREQITQITIKGGVSEATVLSIAGEIARIENNLQHMEDMPGRKQVIKALERMKGAFLAEDYTIVSLLGHPYVEGMNAKAVFVPDESLEEGTSVIQSIQKPQVNYRGKMIQAACITVGQNL